MLCVDDWSFSVQLNQKRARVTVLAVPKCLLAPAGLLALVMHTSLLGLALLVPGLLRSACTAELSGGCSVSSAAMIVPGMRMPPCARTGMPQDSTF